MTRSTSAMTDSCTSVLAPGRSATTELAHSAVNGRTTEWGGTSEELGSARFDDLQGCAQTGTSSRNRHRCLTAVELRELASSLETPQRHSRRAQVQAVGRTLRTRSPAGRGDSAHLQRRWLRTAQSAATSSATPQPPA